MNMRPIDLERLERLRGWASRVADARPGQARILGLVALSREAVACGLRPGPPAEIRQQALAAVEAHRARFSTLHGLQLPPAEERELAEVAAEVEELAQAARRRRQMLARRKVVGAGAA